MDVASLPTAQQVQPTINSLHDVVCEFFETDSTNRTRNEFTLSVLDDGSITGSAIALRLVPSLT